MSVFAMLQFLRTKGSDLEVQYELLRFGISLQTLPMDISGHLIVDEFLEKLSQRRQQELASSTISDQQSMIRPGKFDVLLGRGRLYQEYSGNLHLAESVRLNKNRYQNGGRGQKSIISKEIVTQIQDRNGGRFLKKTQDGRFWVEVSAEVARDNVGHGFRTKTRRNSISD